MAIAPARRLGNNAPRSRGRRESGSLLGVRIWDDNHSRIYFSIPRRLGTAVKRNRLRRQLREVSRRRTVPARSMLISAAALPESFQDLEDEFDHLLSRLGLSSG
jgi:ribonuclease P protein component